MDSAPRTVAEFSLFAGGPTHRLLSRLGLGESGARNFARRAVFSVLLTWVPLLVLSAAQGLAIGDAVRIPFLRDFAAYARYLVSIPLLILAEGLVGPRVTRAAKHFVRSGLVRDADLPAYESALAGARRLCESTLAEVLLLGLAGASVVIIRNEFPFDFSTWRSLVTGSAHAHTPAGWWNLAVGMGLFHFLFWRWIWRLVIWYRFLWFVSRLPLRLMSTHPDRAAGLGFVGDAQRHYFVVVSAVATAAAGTLADEIVYAGVPLASYEFLVAVFVAAMLLVFLGPLLMFTPRMIEARFQSLHDYHALALTHNWMFDGKWVHGDNPKGEPVLGTPEISSLADLGTAYEMLSKMRPVPFDPADALVLALAVLTPMTPLLLTIMPLQQLLELLSKFLV